MQESNYRTAVIKNLSEIASSDWEQLRQAPINGADNPFLSYFYLRALEESGSACAETGWKTHFLTVWRDHRLHGAMPMYLKNHSYGEYVFDWSWAQAYAQHQLAYYPKLLSAVPFTPVTGPRLLATDETALDALILALIEHNQSSSASSCHVLFLPQAQAERLKAAGFMLRYGVQFHWTNQGYRSFDDFLSRLESKKRKNILAERRKVRDANITFRHKVAGQITGADWVFFVECYKNTYREHGGQGYLNLDFFLAIGASLPDNLLMITAYRDDKPVAASLLFYTAQALYGRYWGCLEYHPCLHFETAYYQPLEFCITQRIQSFEGGAQGEHKMARGFLPETTYSAHHINHPAFADAIDQFLKREQIGISHYADELERHNPFSNQSRNTL